MLQGFNTGNAWGNFINAQAQGHRSLQNGLESLGKAVSDGVIYNEQQKLLRQKEAEKAQLQQAQGAFWEASRVGDEATKASLIAKHPNLLANGFAGKAKEYLATDPATDKGIKHVVLGDKVYLYDANTGQQISSIHNPEPIEPEEPVFDSEMVLKINKDLTPMIKPSVEITRAAKDLESLKSTATPTDQVAAVFKFMKALDPTSTVRDSELGMVYSAEGAGKYLASLLNKALGEGALTPENFQNIVNTSKQLAGSAQQATYGQITNLLDTLEDLPPNLRERLLKRTPQNYLHLMPQKVIRTLKTSNGVIVEEIE